MYPPGNNPSPDPPAPQYETLPFIDSFTSALFKPSEATYQRIANDPNASFWRASLWIFLGALIGSILAAPLSLLFDTTQLDQFRQAFGETGNALTGAAGLLLCCVPFLALLSVIGAIIASGVYQLVARLLGGAGDFNGLYNAYAAFAAPLIVLSYPLGAIPLVGVCLSGLLGLYHLVLTVIAIQAVNRFGYGKAILTVLIPILVITGCCCLFYVLVIAGVMSVGPQLQQLLTPVAP